MALSIRYLPAALALALAAAVPLNVHAGTSSATSCPKPKTHSLPKTLPAGKAAVEIGVGSGSLRPRSVAVALDGTLTAQVVDLPTDRLADPSSTLKGIVALADAEGFFSLAKQIGCPGSAAGADAGSQHITIRTSTGTKTVHVYGSCKPGFNALWAVLTEMVGFNR